MIEFSTGSVNIVVRDYTQISIREEGVTVTIENKPTVLDEKIEHHNKYVLNNDEKHIYYKKDLENGFGSEIPDYLEKNEETEINEEQEKEISYDPEILRDGAIALRGLIEGWSVGYRQEVEQPDRQKLLFESLEFDGGKVLKYIYHCDGLTKAIIECTELDRSLARDIAMNVCQVSSIIFPPLADTCEMSFKI